MNTKLLKNVRLTFLKSSTLLLIFAFSVCVLPKSVFAVVEVSAAADKMQDENFDKKFREGRDLIDKQEWAKAAEKFNEVINQYPGNKSVDAALYWLAFCYKKQREFKKLGAAVDRLLKDYPSSSWTSDARVLLIEVAQPTKVIPGTTAQNTTVLAGQNNTVTVANTYSSNRALKPAQSSATVLSATTNIYDSYAALSGFYAGETKTPLDRADEIKIAAFQSLLAADYVKAFQAMNGVLNTDSNSSEGLKIEVLRALRRPRLIETVMLAERAPGNTSPTVKSQYAASLKEPLFKLFRDQSNPKIRTEIIYTLANLKDEQATNYLSQIYNSEKDNEVKKAIINGFGSSWGGFSGIYAFTPTTINGVSGAASGQNVTFATAGVPAEKQPEFAKLLEIVKTEKDAELRRLALTNLQRFSGWQNNAQMVDVLSQIYDSETDENFKKTIIRSLARFDQPQAAKKLLDIAKNDKSDKLKLEAIYALGKSKDPAALTYLQQVLQ